MPLCSRCYKKMTYGQSLKSLVSVSRFPLACKECGQVHEISLLSRFLFSLSVVAVPLIVGPMLFREVFGVMLFYLGWVAVIVFLFPFFVKYKAK